MPRVFVLMTFDNELAIDVPTVHYHLPRAMPRNDVFVQELGDILRICRCQRFYPSLMKL
jgi:hypothetical protein